MFATPSGFFKFVITTYDYQLTIKLRNNKF